ncbi:AAA family ATPase [Thioalkalivibrio sp. K90mix]|uniref:AAA family ATPase n=1 Tax=Thioalkalivibrio sp. (strain K90mix) TaxID=396595 RepID=UPI001FCC8785|nr:AAA family ATPase [Thioalkalivibrio sp. K90mix]
MNVPVNTEPHERIPEIDEEHVFSKQFLRVMLNWALRAKTQWSLYLTGPSGVGKSTGPRQVAARLGIKVYSATAHGRMELDELLGQKDIVDGDTLTIDGPLAEAYRTGGWFILEEVDLLEPDIAAGLNTLLEKGKVSLPNGEVIDPHPDFRFIMTGNTNGSGDYTGVFAGTKVMNRAFLERCWIVPVKHLPREKEMEILKGEAQALPEDILEGMLDIADEVRDMSEGNGSAQIECSLSIRILRKWVECTELMEGVTQDQESPIVTGLDIALGNGTNPATRMTLQDLCKKQFGVA